MEGVAGREGPSVRISSNGGGGSRQRDPPLAFRATERLVAGRGTSPLAFRATEGGKVTGSCRLSVTVVCEQKV